MRSVVGNFILVKIRIQFCSKGNWRTNHDTCCSLGMRPIWFDGQKDMQCLSNYIKTFNWTLNLNYWVGGIREDVCWKWCSSLGSLSSESADLAWMSREPDNVNGNESCLHLRIYNNGSNVALSDKKCSSKYVMACKVLFCVSFRSEVLEYYFRALLS
jgi:hypothetical protein